MKKFLSVILTLLLLFSVFYIDSFSITIKAETVYEEGHFSYTVTNNEATIVDYNYYCDSTLYIPSILGGYPVTSIGYHAFSGINDTKSIVIPEGIKTIDEMAFYYITSLLEITIPSSLESIGKKAFGSCYRLSSVKITDLKSWCNIEIADIDSHPFSDCSYAGYYYLKNELINDLIIPDDVTVIKDYAFYKAKKILSVTIPRGVTSIGSASLPDGNDMLEKVNITDIAAWCNIEFYDNPLYKTNLYLNDELVTDLVIPNEVNNINDYAFRMCKSIDRIIMPKNITRIGKQSFSSDRIIDVYYMDSSKYGIEILDGNSELQWHYNTCEEEHEYSEDCGTECNKCDWIRDPISEHTYSNACDMYCNKCFEKRAVGSHIYDNNCDTECNECEATRKITHTYINTCDTECNICSFIREIEHTYSYACDTECNVCKELREVGEHDFSLNCGLTCIHCKYSKKPDVPQAIEVNHNSIILKNYEGLEYSIDGINWQISNTFKNLTPNSEYSFYQRVKASNNALVSESSDGVSIFTKKTFNMNFNANGGSNTPATQLKGEGVPINISSQKPTRNGYVFVGWGTTEKCGKQYAPGEEYTKDEDITFYALWYEFDDCDNCKGTGKVNKICSQCEGKGRYAERYCLSCGSKNITNYITGTVLDGYRCNSCLRTNIGIKYIDCYSCKYTGKIEVDCSVCNGTRGDAIKPIAPIIVSFTDTTVTLRKQEMCEYSKDGVTWQESNVFLDLLSATDYTFYIRQTSTETTPFSPISLGVTIKTDKTKQTLIPNAPTVQSSTATSITLNAVDGCEYSKDGVNWQSSNIFSGLLCGTEYTFYQRYKETETTYVSKSSEPFVVKTDKGIQSKPSSPTILSKTHNSVTLTALSGYEYSRDGINWQSSNVFSELTPETNYMFYQRKAETAIYYVSEASAARTVKTDEEPTYTLGDIDGLEGVTDADAEYMLMYTFFPEDYPVNQECDFNGDGKVNDADAEHLLMFTFFPEDYPLH